MQRTLFTPGHVGGGATQLRLGLKAPNVVFIQNNDANADAYFGHNRLTLQQPRADGGIQGFKVAKNSNTQLMNWEGDLWGVASVDGANVDVEVSLIK
jgi:hypothetical protein